MKRIVMAAFVMMALADSACADSCADAKAQIESAQTVEEVAQALALAADVEAINWLKEQGSDSLGEAKKWAHEIMEKLGC